VIDRARDLEKTIDSLTTTRATDAAAGLPEWFKSAADAFKKISIAPRTSRESHVKNLFLSAFESRDDFLGRNDEPKRSREIIRRAQRKDTQRNAAIDKAESNLSNRPVTTGGKHQVSRLLERLFEAGLFRGLISCVVARFSERRHQLILTVSGVASFRIVY
jgi:hypothetical protein